MERQKKEQIYSDDSLKVYARKPTVSDILDLTGLMGKISGSLQGVDELDFKGDEQAKQKFAGIMFEGLNKSQDDMLEFLANFIETDKGGITKDDLKVMPPAVLSNLISFIAGSKEIADFLHSVPGLMEKARELMQNVKELQNKANQANKG